jgi:phosphoribosylformylglycinamidine synthase
LGTPITGGNVSLYNETRGEGIYPTPVLGVVGILEDVTKAVPSSFQRAGDAILLLWPIPHGQQPDPNLKVPFEPVPINRYIVYPLTVEPPFPIASPLAAPVADVPDDSTETPASELAAFGSSEYAKVVLNGLWGTPPPLDLEAEADLHTLLAVLADSRLIVSASDISDGGIAVALAQAAFQRSIGATVDQDQSLLAHPLFGLFAEPATTMIVTTHSSHVSDIEKLAAEYSFMAARIGTTGGQRLEITVDREPFISASLAELRPLWAESLEATLHDEVLA